MRITNNMMAASTIKNINNAATRLNTAQARMSSQQKIQLPSDDPVVATRAIKYRNYVASVEQYQKNVDDVTSWQEVTDSALSELGDVIQSVRELTVQASSDTLSDTDRAAIKTEVEELQKQAVQIMNTSYAGRYVFGGYSTGEEPYKLVTTDLGTAVTFKGQYLSVGAVAADTDDTAITDFYTDNAANLYASTGTESIQYNIGFNAKTTVNIEGQDVTGQGTGSNLFDTFSKLLLALDGETSYKTADTSTSPATVTTNSLSITGMLDELDTDQNRLLTAQAVLGARMSYVSKVADRLSTDYSTYSTLMSNNEDVDVSEASIDVTSAEYVYQASLTVGAKVITKTLVDYIA